MIHPDRLRPLGLVALYAALVVGWVCSARWVVPPVIVAAYQGRGRSILDRFFGSPASPLPVEQFLDRWREFSGAVAIAGVLHCTLVLFVRRLDLRHAEAWASAEGRVDRGTNLGLILISFAFLAVTLLSGPLHDYVFDLQIWHEVRQGHDPWYLVPGHEGAFPLNAYGPLFNVLAGLAWVNPLAPKLLFAYAYLLVSVWLIKGPGARRPLAGLPALGLMAWLWNPFPWVEIAIRGHFDILVGIACVAAVHARVRGRDMLSGGCLALGVLVKYIPIVILPFLILDGGRFRLRLLFIAVVAILFGLEAGCDVWGPSALRPLTFAATRESTVLSIFRFLRGRYSPLHQVWVAPSLDAMATPILFVALLRAWSWCRLRRPDPVTSALVATLTTLLFYQVGFPQYQMVLFVLATYWAIRYWGCLKGNTPLAVAMGSYFGWLALFDVFYESNAGLIPIAATRWITDEDWVGLPTFLLGCALLACVVRSSRSIVEMPVKEAMPPLAGSSSLGAIEERDP